MASTYSTSLQIQLIANGEQSGVWGTTTNTNWNLIEQAVAGVQSITMINANYTLTGGAVSATINPANNPAYSIPPYQMLAANMVPASATNQNSAFSTAGFQGGSVLGSVPAVGSINSAAPSFGGSSASATSMVTAAIVKVQLANGEVQTILTTAIGDSGFSYTVPQGLINNIPAIAGGAFSAAPSGQNTAAVLADGSSLPRWLNYDAATKTFSAVQVPEGVSSLRVKVQVKEGTTVVGEVEMTIIVSSE